MTIVEGWGKTRLGKVASLVKGISYKSEDYCGLGEGAVFITIKCVSKSGGFKYEGIKYFKGLIAATQILKAGDLLIANTDLTRAGDIVGCPIMIPKISSETITMSMDLSKLVEDDGKIDRDFFYYKLMTDPVRRFMKEHSSGSTVLHLHTRAVSELELEMPSSKLEQTKIAEVISTVDRAIEQTEALIAKQQRIKTGLMQDLLTRGIDEHGNLRSEQTHKFKDSPLGRIPVEWKVDPIGNGIDFITDYRGKTPPYVSDGIPVISAENVGKGIIKSTTKYVTAKTYTKWTTRGFPEPQDIVFTTEAPVGEIAYYPGDRTYLLTRRVIALRPDEGKLLKPFLFWNLLRVKYQGSWEKFIAGTTAPRIKKPDILAYQIPFPDQIEQDKIASVLESSKNLIENETESLAKLNRLKTGLIQDLLTGEKRVTALLSDTEVASV